MSWIAKLLPEQLPAFEFVCSRPGTILLGDTSAGKTFITMAAIERTRPRLTLIVAPLTSLDITWAPKLATLQPNGVFRDWEDFKAGKGLGSSSILLIHFQLFAKLAEKLERVPWDSGRHR